MRSAPTTRQWVATWIGCAVGCATLAHPHLLPRPLRPGVEQAVDGAARLWLWLWGEPHDMLDNPVGEWHAPGRSLQSGRPPA